MLSKIKQLLETKFEPEQVLSSEEQLKSACAALLMEVARADLEVDDVEQKRIEQAMQQNFGLSSSEVDELVASVSEDDHSIHPFTAMVNEHYDYPQKLELMNHLWAVAFADSELSQYEDATIRKIADLLYVRHSDFIKTKLNQKQN